jgi:hypothetical protein
MVIVTHPPVQLIVPQFMGTHKTFPNKRKRFIDDDEALAGDPAVKAPDVAR